jgi:uronate dehydrogenase
LRSVASIDKVHDVLDEAMNQISKVALTGAGGNIGRFLRTELPKHGVALRSSVGIEPPESIAPGEDVQHGDLRDPAVVDRLLQGVDVVIHLAGTSVERPLGEIIDNNLVALHQLYEGARRHKVRRIVFASSNHAFGMYSVDEKIDIDAPFRPDCFYGLSKAWGELMGRMYWDKHGIETIAVRIGSCLPEPENHRNLSTWLSHADVTDLMLGCIRAPRVGFTAVWAISDNTRAYWTPLVHEGVGYHPRDNAETHAARIEARPHELDPVSRSFQGGAFVTIDYTDPQARPVK